MANRQKFHCFNCGKLVDHQSLTCDEPQHWLRCSHCYLVTRTMESHTAICPNMRDFISYELPRGHRWHRILPHMVVSSFPDKIKRLNHEHGVVASIELPIIGMDYNKFCALVTHQWVSPNEVIFNGPQSITSAYTSYRKLTYCSA